MRYLSTNAPPSTLPQFYPNTTVQHFNTTTYTPPISSYLTTLYTGSYITLLLLASTSLFVHLVGLLAIHLHKKDSNSNRILLSLSVAEMLLSVHRIIYEVTEEAHLRGSFHIVELAHGHIEGALFYVSSYATCLIMYVLTLDRMVCASTPLKYRSRMTRKRTMVLLFIAWFFSLVLGCTTGFLSFHQRIWANLIGITLGGIYTIFAVATYSLIVIRIRSARKQFGRSQRRTTTTATMTEDDDGGSRRRKVTRQTSTRIALKSSKEFLVPTILISSYLLLYIAPLVVTNFSFVESTGVNWRELGDDIAKKKSESLSYCALTALPYVGIVIDGITYIFLTKHYRENIVRFVTRGRRDQGRVSTCHTMHTSTGGGVSTIR